MELQTDVNAAPVHGIVTMPFTPYYDCDGITIYNADCRKVLPWIEHVDLLLTDPPYGIAYDPTRYKTSTRSETIEGDDRPFDPWQLVELPATDKVIWGGNNFAHRMPKGGWLCWDKRCTEQADKVLGSPIELAWVSKETMYCIKRLQHAGAKNADGEGKKRIHPTQKPIRLMQWCLGLFPKAERVLDPFAGSGTTGVACKLEGRKAVLIEISEEYCEAAAKRLQQGVLF